MLITSHLHGLSFRSGTDRLLGRNVGVSLSGLWTDDRREDLIEISERACVLISVQSPQCARVRNTRTFFFRYGNKRNKTVGRVERK